MDKEALDLSESLVDELVGALGLSKTTFWHAIFWRLGRRITHRLAKLGIDFNRVVDHEGLPAGSEWVLRDFCTPVQVHGMDNLQHSGPLLIVSNHPGAYDALVILSKLIRKDITWVSSEIPALERLPIIREHILFSSRTNVFNRMTVMRKAIRHLKTGGALLYFGAGHRDPDPAVYSDAGKMLANWLPGIEFFFKHIPDLKLQPTIVSGVVSKKWSRHPITLLRRKQIDKQRLSEFGQVINQLLYPGKLKLSPAISFGPTVSIANLPVPTKTCDLLRKVIEIEKDLLIDHCRHFGGNPGI